MSRGGSVGGRINHDRHALLIRTGANWCELYGDRSWLAELWNYFYYDSSCLRVPGGMGLDKWDCAEWMFILEYGVVYSRVNICPYISYYSVNMYLYMGTVTIICINCIRYHMKVTMTKGKRKKEKKKKQSLAPGHTRHRDSV